MMGAAMSPVKEMVTAAAHAVTEAGVMAATMTKESRAPSAGNM
jgi:hypothetical protein